MAAKPKRQPEQMTLNGLPLRICESCGASAHQGLSPDHPLQGMEPVICSISTQIYRRVPGVGRIQVATPSFHFCDKCLQAALVTPILFESREGSELLKALRNSLISRYKALLEEQGQ